MQIILPLKHKSPFSPIIGNYILIPRMTNHLRSESFFVYNRYIWIFWFGYFVLDSPAIGSYFQVPIHTSLQFMKCPVPNIFQTFISLYEKKYGWAFFVNRPVFILHSRCKNRLPVESPRVSIKNVPRVA
ncbi:hypothetical protein FWK35_00032643 [Aphis craccivora]|uniref:Uncharacterized protein n=1 Tax=Aphis craccivora TaxID=307492 RepID=A0A6G0XIA8_APHCR|nr:hypothetical protein FWK35_00032643 [Aphis craccivora]